MKEFTQGLQIEDCRLQVAAELPLNARCGFQRAISNLQSAIPGRSPGPFSDSVANGASYHSPPTTHQWPFPPGCMWNG